MAPTQKRRPKGRPRLPGGRGKPTKQNKASSFTAKEKLKVLNHLEKFGDIEMTVTAFYPDLPAEKYNSRRTLILPWRRKRLKIEELCCQRGGAIIRRTRLKGDGTILPAEEEQRIVRWVNGMRDEGVPVTPIMLQIHALETAKTAGITLFKASWTWQRLFKGRYRLSLRCKTRQGQIRLPDLALIAADFSKEVKAKAAEIGATRIFNADQTAACFEYLPKKTLAKTGSKTVWVRCGGKSKDRATVMLLGDSTGVKYTPFVVFKVRPSKVPERQEENESLRHGFSTGMW